jgi:uncharacterized membrane protein YheB (UPF0754 family)
MPDIVLLLLTIPVITAVIGWVTNWAAVKMIFHPERFVGVGPIGWQAILTRRANKFATGIADMATENLISAREIAERLHPEEMEKVFADTLDQQTEIICAKAADEIRPGAWAEMPPQVRQMIVMQVRQQSRELAHEIFQELQGISDELLDLHHLIHDQLSGDNVKTLVDMTKRIGQKEFKFIEYYGGVFGFLIGLAQVGVWTSMQTWWLMPIVGVLVGLVTNWLAIQMIFRPQEPTKYFGLITYQGMFAKRQAQIAHDYGEVAANELLTPRNLIRLVTEGEAGERIAKIVADIISNKIDTEWKKVEKMVPVEVTPDKLESIKQMIIEHLAETAPDIQPEIESYIEEKLDIARTVEERLASLDKPRFERILRGIFEEDEITLIIVGGVLGFGVGALQGMLVLAM